MDTPIIRVAVDLGALAGLLDVEAKQQLPFATSRAMNAVAKRAVDALRAQLPADFIIRSKWVPGGIGASRATKTALELDIGSRSEFMRIQTEGGVVTPTGGRISVPVPAEVRKTPEQRIPSSRWPGKLLKRPKMFVAPIWKGSKSRGVFRRRTKARHPLDLLWILAGEAHVKKRWKINDVVVETFARYWQAEAMDALQKAIADPKTGKKRAKQ